MGTSGEQAAPGPGGLGSGACVRRALLSTRPWVRARLPQEDSRKLVLGRAAWGEGQAGGRGGGPKVAERPGERSALGDAGSSGVTG